jgi:bacillithiol biosynthesis deacetylase BshB1
LPLPLHLSYFLMTKISLDILAFAAHPDDVEISCGATLIKAIDSGKRVGIIDFTAGEMGSRGSGELRLEEARQASELLRLSIRHNLGLRDCFFESSESTLLDMVNYLRHYQPEIVLCNSPTDRHPDHGRASKMVREACFYSGLGKIETHFEGAVQAPWRPKAVYQYIQDYYLKPDVVVDITGYWERKTAVLKCYGSQFHSAESNEIQTPISGEEFFDFLYGKALNLGRQAGMTLGEGFISDRYIGVSGLDQLI